MTMAAERVVAAIVRNGDRVLLCHRHPGRTWYPNVWDLPGGHVEPHEHPAAALVRELREELAIDIAEPLGDAEWTVTDTDTDTDMRVEMSIWVIDHDGPITNAAPDEHDELRWCAAAAITQLDLAHHTYPAMLRAALGVTER